MLPEWVCQRATPRLAPPSTGRSRCVSRALRGMARMVQDTLFCERAGRRPFLLQGLDARVKLISVLALAVGASFLHHVGPLLLLGLFAASALLASRVEASTLFSPTWWVMPGLFALVGLPSMLSVFVPGDPIVALPWGISITRQGLGVAALLASRIAVGVMLGLVLALTTRWHELLRAAHTSVTAPFVLAAMMMYRYMFVLLRVAEAMHLGRQARTICPGTARQERAWIGGRVGALFVRSRRLSEQVYAAMRARGYDGEPKALTRTRIGAGEIGWLFLCGAVFAGALYLDRALLRHLPW